MSENDGPYGFAEAGRDEDPRTYPPGTYPGHPGADSGDGDDGDDGDGSLRGPSVGHPYQPPYGFALDGRPENPRQFPSPPGPQGHPGSS